MKQNPEVIIQSAEEWLKKPMKRDTLEAMGTATEIVVGLVALMKEGVGSKKELGALLGRVKSTQKAIENIETMDWVKVQKGHLAIGHRPSVKMGIDLKLQNTTHILTLLSENEQAKSIQSIALKNHLEWLWFPMTSAQPPDESRYQELAEVFGKMKVILNKGGKIYIHCSAGIHRTGMISLAFLRYLDIEADRAMDVLKALRTKTSEEVGTERAAWAHRVYQKLK